LGLWWERIAEETAYLMVSRKQKWRKRRRWCPNILFKDMPQ
jgi:hypothetical protein